MVNFLVVANQAFRALNYPPHGETLLHHNRGSIMSMASPTSAAPTKCSSRTSSRAHRSPARKVFFLTGLDEHGQKVQQAALALCIGKKIRRTIVMNFPGGLETPLAAKLGINQRRLSFAPPSRDTSRLSRESSVKASRRRLLSTRTPMKDFIPRRRKPFSPRKRPPA